MTDGRTARNRLSKNKVKSKFRRHPATSGPKDPSISAEQALVPIALGCQGREIDGLSLNSELIVFRAIFKVFWDATFGMVVCWVTIKNRDPASVGPACQRYAKVKRLAKTSLEQRRPCLLTSPYLKGDVM